MVAAASDGMLHSGKKASSRGHRKFVGIRRRASGRWVAESKDSVQKVRLWLGIFDAAEDAARAYDTAARALHGSNARINSELPEPAPEHSGGNNCTADTIEAEPFSFEDVCEPAGAGEDHGLLGALKAKLCDRKGVKFPSPCPIAGVESSVTASTQNRCSMKKEISSGYAIPRMNIGVASTVPGRTSTSSIKHLWQGCGYSLS